jgi:ADP-ribosylglycohydrolase
MEKEETNLLQNGGSKSEAAGLVILGAICGDIIGSFYEFASTKDVNFELFTEQSRFTDDTVCTIAIADALANGKSFSRSLRYWCPKYPHAGYGGKFSRWFHSKTMTAYGSWGNGSAMRVSAVGAYAQSEKEVLSLAKDTAKITHNHPEGIKGAQATALAIYLALHGSSKDEIKTKIETRFGYDLSRKYSDIQAKYHFDVSCQYSVPESIIAFLTGHDYESTVRLAVAYGGDADTMAAIAGGIAAAYYGNIPSFIQDKCMNLLPDEMKAVIAEFRALLADKVAHNHRSVFRRLFEKLRELRIADRWQ